MIDLQILRYAIKLKHGCDSVHVKSVPMRETSEGKILWDGIVEEYRLIDHPKASRCYAWANDATSQTKYVTILELPPVDSAKRAVQVSIAPRCKAVAAKLKMLAVNHVCAVCDDVIGCGAVFEEECSDCGRAYCKSCKAAFCYKHGLPNGQCPKCKNVLS